MTATDQALRASYLTRHTVDITDAIGRPQSLLAGRPIRHLSRNIMNIASGRRLCHMTDTSGGTWLRIGK
jgi:hypothetical protein